MAREDLLDERRTRARHAHDEHGPLRLQAAPAHSCEELGRERRDQPVDKRSVRIGVVVHTALAEIGPLQGVGLEGQARGAVELTPGVDRAGQAEEERPALLRGQVGAGEQALDRAPLRLGERGGHRGRQPGQDQGVPGLVPQCLAERGNRLVEVSELFEDAPEPCVGGNQVRLEPDRRAVARLGLVQPSQCMKDVAQVVVSPGKVGAKADSLLAMPQSLVEASPDSRAPNPGCCAPAPNWGRAVRLAGDDRAQRPSHP